jgi:TetR/AcrR family transcriptional regulator
MCFDLAGARSDESSRLAPVHAAVIRKDICSRCAGYRRGVTTTPASNRTPDPTKRTGRPRRNGTPLDGDPRDEILSVASRLFSERGVAATTMAEIARRSGLQQSSVYHYFGNKEQVLGAIVAEANRAPLELVKRIRADGATPVVQLYRIIRADVAALCALPYDLNELHRLAARDPKAFARYWKERDQLHGAVAEVVREGVDAGELRELDPRLAALTVMSNDEATQNWMRHDPRRETAPATVGGNGPYAIGTFLADLTVRGLLVSPRDLDRVRRNADALDARSAVFG